MMCAAQLAHWGYSPAYVWYRRRAAGSIDRRRAAAVAVHGAGIYSRSGTTILSLVSLSGYVYQY